MKKTTILLAFLMMSVVNSQAQTFSVSPAEDDILCPGVNYEFTVYLPNTALLLSLGVNADPVEAVIVAYPYDVTIVNNVDLTFKFVGRFVDENKTQVFTLAYKLRDASTITTRPLKYTKVKSFKHPNPGSIPQINTINLLRCQGQTLNISSNPVNYYNQTNPSQPLVVTTETSWQYQVPSGWSVGGAPSNGTNWIDASNNATITSTASGGGPVKVRAVNSCGSNLLPGEEAVVAVSRPVPQLSMSGDDFLCSGSKTYGITGTIPPGASICWSSSNTNAATLGTSCGVPAVLNYVNAGQTKLSATVTDCEGTYAVANTKDLLIGAYAGGYYTITSNYHSSGNQLTLYNNNSTIFLPANQGFGINAYLTSVGRTGNATWTRNASSYPFFWYQIGASTLTFSGNSAPTSYQQRTGIFNLSVPTACGTFNGQFSWPIVTQGWSFRVASAPNPSTNTLSVSVVDSENSTQKLATTSSSSISMDLSRFDNARQVKSWTFKGGLSEFILDVSDLPNGTYVLRVTIDGSSKTSQIIIKR